MVKRSATHLRRRFERGIISGEARMPISERTRKILWGRSGNLCAYCRRTLVEECSPHNAESVVGDECHIIGEKPAAARGVLGVLGVGRDDLDEYDIRQARTN
jgi:hypothetical protein